MGIVKVDEGVEEGIGLLVIDVGRGVYRRLGLVIFTDMTVWKGAKPRDITLEPKLGG